MEEKKEEKRIIIKEICGVNEKANFEKIMRDKALVEKLKKAIE